jgi:hypothetical protein
MASYLDTTVDAATMDLTGEHGASQAAAEVEAEASELFTRDSAATAWMPAVWKVYAVLALAVGAFLVAVLLMATGLVDAPST